MPKLNTTTAGIFLILYTGPEWCYPVVSFDDKEDADTHCAELERARLDPVLQRSIAKHRPHPELSKYIVITLCHHTRTVPPPMVQSVETFFPREDSVLYMQLAGRARRPIDTLEKNVTELEQEIQKARELLTTRKD